MARISATPNPVGVYSPNVPTYTFVEWNSEAAFPVIAYQVTATGEQPLPGQPPTGARSGSTSLQVTLPNSYELVLRRSDSQPGEVARITVTTFDLRKQLAESFSQAYLPHLRPQAITRLSVIPIVDTVEFSFETIKPTIPRTTIFDQNGTVVDARFPLFGGLQTKHRAVFGLERPLEQEAKHSFEIVAAGRTGNPKSPAEVILKGEFVTGRRSVDIVFDELTVLNDGDPGLRGTGELTFRFGAGDAETGAPMGEPWPTHGPANIMSTATVALGGKITIRHAPRQLWIQAVGQEDDGTILLHENGIGFGMRPTFDGPGSRGIWSESAQLSSATIVLDIDDLPGIGTGGFNLRTGRFDVAFSIDGTLTAEAVHGTFVPPKKERRGSLPRSSGLLSGPGDVVALAAGGVGERIEALARGADGGLYRKAVGPLRDQGSDGQWTRIDVPADGAISAAASDAQAIDLVLHDASGGVAYRRFDHAKPRSGSWRRLGGNFREVALLAGTAKTAPLVVGLAEDGDLHAMAVADGNKDWRRVGDRTLRAFAMVQQQRGPAALIGVTSEGQLQQFTLNRDSWRARDLGVRVPEGAGVQAVTAIMSEPRGKDKGELIIGVLGEDHSVRAIRLSPDGENPTRARWEEFGTYQDLWIASGSGELEGRRKPAPRKTKASAA